MIEAGVAVVDITPPAGLAMAGFGARIDTATGAHDRLGIRALVVNDTALVVADVIGIDAALSRRVRSRCGLPSEKVTLAATHTHGGPISMDGRLGGGSDPGWMARFEHATVSAIRQAAEARVPAVLWGGVGNHPGFARNRRHADGAVDGVVPVFRVDRADGRPMAILVSYACHPVVLSSDNLQWTADYPHFLRAALEKALPGAVAIFATGCAGDANTGHSAADSLNPAANADRTFARAEEIGKGVAEAALAAELSPLGEATDATEARAELSFQRREACLGDLAKKWTLDAESADPIRAHLLRIWAAWARDLSPEPPEPMAARVSAMDWGGAGVLALPGEIFASTALDLRALDGRTPLFVLAYADDNPGYIPPRAEYAHGGYEIEEAHRFYGLPGTFASGTAEDLARAVAAAAARLESKQARIQQGE